MSRSCLFSLSCRSNSSKSDMLKRPCRPCTALASPCRPPAPAASATSAARFGYFRAPPTRRRLLLPNQAQAARPAPAPPLPRRPARPPTKSPSPRACFRSVSAISGLQRQESGAVSSAASENTRSEGFAGFPGCKTLRKLPLQRSGVSVGSQLPLRPATLGPPKVRLLPTIQTVPVFHCFRRGSPLLSAGPIRATRYF